MRPIVATLTRLALFTLAAAQLGAAEYNPARTRPGADAEPTVDRFIVKLRASSALTTQAAAGNGESASSAAAAAAKQRIAALAGRANVTMRETHPVGPNLHVMQVSPVTRGEALKETLARLSADSDVEYAVPDRRMYAHAVSNDPLATGQWYLQAVQPSAINASAAWDITTGRSAVVTADIDTGVRFDHPDLSARLLPGYDFVSADPDGSFKTANDGDGRDSDASDPGDWVTSADSCGTAADSSWHGTRVSGIIAASTNNAVGVAGITWSGKILPVRVLGKCGGFNSDVLAGINWAAGISVPGVPDNPTPAKIINISLGGKGACDSASADVISTVASRGVLVVVSAGNEGGPVDSPANCPGAMGIAGLRQAGTKVGFSSLGPEIALSAPAGNCVNTTPGSACLYSIDTTTNTGTTTPATNTYTDQFNINVGTSFSAPIVSGIAGLMLGVNSHLKSPQLIARLKESASVFPTSSENTGIPVCHTPSGATDVQNTECVCTTSVCGAGMANARGAVNAALRPIADIVVQGSVAPGGNVTLQGSGSTAADNHTIASYLWIKGGSTISSASTANVIAPASGLATVCLTVTDDVGKQDSAKVAISQTTATVSLVPPGTNACATEVAVSATDANATETGDTGTFTLTRTGDISAALAVTIAMSGTALSGTDYQTIGTSVAFSAGASTATVTLTPIDNSITSGSKTATLTVQNGTAYTAGSPNSATVTIVENYVAAASSSGGGGGGGGALDELMLMGLALAVLAGLARAHLPRGAKNLRQHFAAEQRRARRQQVHHPVKALGDECAFTGGSASIAGSTGG